MSEPPGMKRIVYGFGRWPASCLALVVVNLIPLLGVMFFGWSVFVVLFTCWMENAVTGANQLAIAALVLVKIVFDLYAHLSERKKFERSGVIRSGL